MTKYVALLRGINVGGGNKILMVDLKAALLKKGLLQLSTYIQSGNLVFVSNVKSEELVSKLISECILEQFDLNIPCIAFNETDYKQLVAGADWSAFENFDPKMAYFSFFNAKVDAMFEYDAKRFFPDIFKINGSCAYVYVPTGAGKTKLTNLYLEKLTGKISSTRNYRTTYKLLELLNDLEA